MSKEIREQINKIKILNESKTFKLYNPRAGSPSEIEIQGKPLLWGMRGPLPDNVIQYIRKNLKPVVDWRDGKVALHPTTKEPYVRPLKGKNSGDLYFFDESTGNWWNAHERFQGKAVFLSPDEWDEVFGGA
jgi:hypothetical protein